MGVWKAEILGIAAWTELKVGAMPVLVLMIQLLPLVVLLVMELLLQFRAMGVGNGINGGAGALRPFSL